MKVQMRHDACDEVVKPDLISIPEAARRVGVHADTLYRLCRTGQFPPAIQIGSRWRVSVPRLERFLHEDEREVVTFRDSRNDS
jgi:excisionase family DNA binding protein